MRRRLKREGLAYSLFILFLLYLNIISTFALIFFVLDRTGLGPIVDHYISHEQWGNGFDTIGKYLYFSAITLLSVGYGDLTPFGWSKLAAVIEAMLGYILAGSFIIEYLRRKNGH